MENHLKHQEPLRWEHLYRFQVVKFQYNYRMHMYLFWYNLFNGNQYGATVMCKYSMFHISNTMIIASFFVTYWRVIDVHTLTSSITYLQKRMH